MRVVHAEENANLPNNGIEWLFSGKLCEIYCVISLWAEESKLDIKRCGFALLVVFSGLLWHCYVFECTFVHF